MCGGFDWSDEAFERAYGRLEASLYGTQRAYGAVAPVVGLSTGEAHDLGGGLRIRQVASGELAAHWPQARDQAAGRVRTRTRPLCVLELEQAMAAGGRAGRAGRVRRCDHGSQARNRRAGRRRASPLRAPGLAPLRHPPGLADRGHRALGRACSDRFSHRPTGEEARERLLLTDEDRDLGEALDRWELSLYQSDPFASEQLRGSLTGALGAGEGLFAASLRPRRCSVRRRASGPLYWIVCGYSRRATQPRRRESLSAGRLSKCSRRRIAPSS